jgi:hypothetical protein
VTRNQALEDEIQELRRQRLVDITMIQNLRWDVLEMKTREAGSWYRGRNGVASLFWGDEEHGGYWVFLAEREQ